MRRVALGLALVLLLSGCPRPEAPSGDEALKDPKNPFDGEDARCFQMYIGMVIDRMPDGMNSMVNNSHAGFIGNVVELTAPRWNSRDGELWPGVCVRGDEDRTPVQPFQYRDARIEVTQVLYSSQEAPVEVGRVISVRFKSDYTRPDDTVGYERELYGEVREDTTVLVVVRKLLMGTQGGTEPYLYPDPQGYWRIESGTAIHRRPERTVPLDSLLARIKEERSIGPNYERDKGTVYNPLGEPGKEEPLPSPSY